jgi:hypothetical protein
MVKKEYINWIISKCATISDMKYELNSISFNDQFNQLKEKGLLNPLEEKDFLKSVEKLEKEKEDFENFKGNDFLEQMHKETIKDLEDNLFSYGRRLIEGYPMSFPVNLDDYKDKAGQRDEQFPMWEYDEDLGEDAYTYDIKHKMGFHEEKQVELQEKAIQVDPDDVSTFINNDGELDVGFNDKRLESMDNYFAGDMNHINYDIYHEAYLNKLTNETRKHMKNIDSLMEDSTGLPYNTLLFRGGMFDIHTRIGETITFKGYTSTTFQHSVAEYYKPQDGMLYLIHAPKGTKGLVGNDPRFNNGFEEHEYVLPRNTKMKVINIDYEKNICEVVIEE